jgi:hypothetical protein
MLMKRTGNLKLNTIIDEFEWIARLWMGLWSFIALFNFSLLPTVFFTIFVPKN